MIYNTKYKIIHGKEIKTLITKKMFQKLLIAFAQVKVGNTFET